MLLCSVTANFVGDAHFGGGLLTRTNDDGAKSRKDLIDQLIAESKKRKAEQQKMKEQTLGLTEKLDTDWKDLLPVITAGPKAADVEKPKPDSYDTLMRELKFEARGKVLIKDSVFFFSVNMFLGEQLFNLNLIFLSHLID